MLKSKWNFEKAMAFTVKWYKDNKWWWKPLVEAKQ